MRISSVHNPVVKHVRSLERARVRREEGVYLAEGVRLVGEAVETQQAADIVLYDPDLLRRSTAGSLLLDRLPDWAERAYEVDDHVLAAVSQTETPPGVLAVLRDQRPAPLSTHRDDVFGLVLDRLGDPGNAGTILRTADAAGACYVVTTPETVDLYAPKVVRAGMGAHFRLPLYQGVSWDELGVALPETDSVATKPGTGNSICTFEWPPRAALIVGSEAHGLSVPADRVAHWIHIPMRRGVESLNASVAASIAIYAALGSSLV